MSECTSNEEHYKPHRDTLSGDSIPVSPIAHDDHTHDYLEALVALLDPWHLKIASRSTTSSARNRGSSIPTCHVDTFHLRYGTSMV